MRIIDRYVIREVLWPFVIGLLVFTFMLIIPFLIEYAESFISKGVADARRRCASWRRCCPRRWR